MEFVAFKEKLERSHQLVVARIESAILSLKRKASNLEELEVTISVRLDFSVRFDQFALHVVFFGVEDALSLITLVMAFQEILLDSVEYSDMGSCVWVGCPAKLGWRSHTSGVGIR